MDEISVDPDEVSAAKAVLLDVFDDYGDGIVTTGAIANWAEIWFNYDPSPGVLSAALHQLTAERRVLHVHEFGCDHWAVAKIASRSGE